MQILKYLLYLMLLSLISIVVYITTLESKFDIVNSYAVNINKKYLKNYFNDPKNWKKINHLQKNDSLNFNEGFWDLQTRLQLTLDSVSTDQSIFKVHLGNDYIGEMAYKYADSTPKISKIYAQFYGQVDFLDKINIFIKGISPNYYFNKIFSSINQQMQNQLNSDFSYNSFAPIKVIKQPKTYFYKSRYAANEILRDNVLSAYQQLSEQINPASRANNSFFIEMLIDQPNRKEYFIGIPVTQKQANLIAADIYLDSIPEAQILQTAFTGDIQFEDAYLKFVKQQVKQQQLQVDFDHKIKIWNTQLKNNNPRNWTFETRYYLLAE